jgi:peptidoglycan/LPS O-acetylase OafA/YrhL
MRSGRALRPGPKLLSHNELSAIVQDTEAGARVAPIRRVAPSPAQLQHTRSRPEFVTRTIEPLGEERMTGGHLPALDGLRGIAVLTVMVLHFTLFTPQNGVEWWYRSITDGGWAGVDLFFVLSGFLITGILYDAKGSAYYFRNFYLRRTLRIFPIYYAFLAAQFLVLPLVKAVLGMPQDVADERQVWVWTYLTNFLFASVGWEGMPGHTTHLWSLAVEEQFYMLWPLVVFMSDRRTLLRICGALFLLGPVTRLALHAIQPSGLAGYVLLPARVDALALGGLIAVLGRSEVGYAQLRRWLRPALAAGLTLLVVGAVITVASGGTGLFPPLSLHTQLIVYPAVALISAAAVVSAAVAKPGSRINAFLTVRPLLVLGKLSYAIYLFHIPLRNALLGSFSNPNFLPRVLGSQIPAQIALMVVCMAVTTAAAAVSWHLFEAQFIALKRFFPYGTSATPAAAPATALASVVN